MSGEQRRLAAIVSADVAGYSRLMGRDESGTLVALKAARGGIIDPRVRAHHGRIVKTTGDGLLLEFASIVDAIRCVTEIQAEMASHNADSPEDNRIEFRVGVNIGDIIIDGDDLYGDGVNVAARLQELAEPGGICVSGRVYEDVRDKLDIVFEDAGEQQLKNIARPVRVFRNRPGQAGVRKQVPLALPDRPSIAVLPFQNMSGDPEQEYFADGVVEDIITALSRFRSLFVIARNSSFTYKGRPVDVKHVGRELGVRYVLEGSVRKSANRLRVAAQLIDALSGAHIWAERFDGALEDIFDLQDRLTEKVVAAIAPKVELAEIARARRKSTDNLDAYDCYLRALACRFPLLKDGLDEALRLLHRAIELDPDFAAAYGLAAQCYTGYKASGLLTGTESERAEIERLARLAARLGHDDAEALAGGAWAFAYALEDLQTGRALIDRALALNVNLAGAWSISGWISLWEGDLDAALERSGRAIRLSPVGMDFVRATTVAAHAYFFLDQYDEALACARKALEDYSEFPPALRIAAASAAFAGRDDLARLMRTRLTAVNPGFSLSRLPSALAAYRNPAFPDKYRDGLRRAGLPE